MIDILQSAALVLLSVAGCFQQFRIRRLAVAAAYAKAEAALAHGQIAMLQFESDTRRNGSALRAIAGVNGRVDDNNAVAVSQIRLECLRLVMGTLHVGDDHRPATDEQIAAADLLARFVMEGVDA